MRRILLILLSLLPLSVFSQKPEDLGLVEHTFSGKNIGVVHYYITKPSSREQKPLLIFLQGSGNQPLFYRKKNDKGEWLNYSSVPLNLSQLESKYHILLVGKPHTPFSADLNNETDDPVTDSLYELFASAEWRVEATSKAIEDVIKHYNINKKKVVAFGYSEGAQIAPRLAVQNKRITHCIAFVGGSLNQFFDEIIRIRLAAYSGELTNEVAQQQIDSLYAVFDQIYKNPSSVKDHWFGHTYKRWSSYTQVPVLQYLVQLDIPVYMAQGTNDQSTSILGSEYIRLEFARLQKHNLTYKTYPGCDHYFNHAVLKKNILADVISEAFHWLDAL